MLKSIGKVVVAAAATAVVEEVGKRVVKYVKKKLR
jgi:hypothetical protein